MVKFKKLLFYRKGLLFLLLVLCQSPVYAIIMGGVIGWNYNWPYQEGGYNRLVAPVQINKDGGSSGLKGGSNYYLAINWGFIRGSGGYIGLQNRNGAHWVNFSIWDVSGWTDANPDAKCKKFSHEGDGVQCEMPYSWQEGALYTLEVKDVGHRQWEGSILSNTGQRTVIARIHGNPDVGGFSSSFGGFIEEFSQGGQQLDSCQDAKPFAAIMNPVTLGVDSSLEPAESVNIFSYGNCRSSGQAHCDSNKTCYGFVNDNSL